MIEKEAELQMEITQEGTGPAIEKGQTAVVHYTGTLVDGTTFDSSLERGMPFRFSLGAGDVIAGWEHGVLGMKKGEKRRLRIPPEMGYGATGAGGVIPPNATLLFDIELVDIEAGQGGN